MSTVIFQKKKKVIILLQRFLLLPCNHLVAVHLINTLIYKNTKLTGTIVKQVQDNRWHRFDLLLVLPI